MLTSSCSYPPITTINCTAGVDRFISALMWSFFSRAASLVELLGLSSSALCSRPSLVLFEVCFQHMWYHDDLHGCDKANSPQSLPDRLIWTNSQIAPSNWKHIGAWVAIAYKNLDKRPTTRPNGRAGSRPRLLYVQLRQMWSSPSQRRGGLRERRLRAWRGRTVALQGGGSSSLLSAKCVHESWRSWGMLINWPKRTHTHTHTRWARCLKPWWWLHHQFLEDWD